MRAVAAACCALLAGCATRHGAPAAAPAGPLAPPPCGAAAPEGWRPGHEPPPLRSFPPAPDPPPSPAVASGALPPLPFTRWPAEMTSWSSAEARASIYAQRWPREASAEAFLRHHLERLSESDYVDVRIAPGSIARGQVERGGRRFAVEGLSFTSAGHAWRSLVYAEAVPGRGVCAFGVTAAELAAGGAAMVQFLRVIDGAPP